MDYQAWCKDCDQQEADQKTKWEVQRSDAKERRQKFIENYREKHGDYWKWGDVYVPLEIGSIPSMDKVNSVSLLSLGANDEPQIVTTAVYSLMEPYTLDEYHAKFCKFDEETERWIYVGRG